MADMQEQIELLLKLSGFESINEVIKQFRDLKDSGEELTKEQEQALIALEATKNITSDLGTEDAKLADAALELARSQKIANDMLVEARDAAAGLEGFGDDESGVGGFKGVATQALKAEKAISSLASGHGLGRLGSMLEGVLGPMGVPGLGLALGGLAFAIEPLLPKIKEFVDAWEMGARKIDETSAAIERFDRAQGDTREKRALGRIDKKIAEIEDKEDEQGWISPGDKEALQKLRERSWTAHQNIELKANAEKRRQEAAKEADEREEAMVAENDPEQQMMERRHAARDARNAEIDAWNQRVKKEKAYRARLHHVEAAQHKEDAEIIREANEEDAEIKRGIAEEKRAEAKAKADARANTPEAINRREQAEQKNEAMGLVQQNTHDFSPKEQAMIAGHLADNHQAGLDMAATFQQALAYAIQQTKRDIWAGVQAGMHRQRVMSEGP